LSLLLLLLLLLLVLLVLLLLLLLLTFPLPSCVRHKGWQQPWEACLFVLRPFLHLYLYGSLVGRFTLTAVVVRLASHCVFQQNNAK
jgi:hypothetical protein